MVVWMIKYPMCFVAGTKVHALSGLKSIEDIQRDDWVLTRDEDNPTSENRYRRVTELFKTSPSRLLTIAYRNDVTEHSQFRESSRRLWESIKDSPSEKGKFTAEQLRAIERGDSKIPGYTWHHHQDGKTMQLVDEVDHALTGHSGGRQLTGGRP
jgi:hypothetical protein